MRTKLDFLQWWVEVGRIIWCKYVYNNIIYTAAGGRENARVYIHILINYSTGAGAHQAEKLEERFLFLNRRHPRERISVWEKSNLAMPRGERENSLLPVVGQQEWRKYGRRVYVAGAGRIARVEFTGLKNRTCSSDLT